MQPRIEKIAEIKLVGMHQRTSFARHQTKELWQRFMPAKKELKNRVGRHLYSLEVYPPSFFQSFDPAAEFEKWAAVEVADFNCIPDGLETLLLPAGRYAVFVHRGPASEGPKTYRYIFETWLPAAAYVLDNRPHFALMGDKYKGDDPASEEEIWIPIRPK